MLLTTMLLSLAVGGPIQANGPTPADSPAAPAASAAASPTLRIEVDSAKHTVTLVAGPFEIPPGPSHAMAGAMHADMKAGMPGMKVIPLMNFRWPVKGWLHGASMQLRDGNGKTIPRRLVHHMNIINFSRRQLLYNAPERILAMGQETEAIDLPRTVGVPVDSGMQMGFVLMWHNSTPKPYEGVTARITLEWQPANQFPRPLSVLPLYMNVIDPVGRPADFDLPAGKTTFHADFTMPLSGRIIGVGGHIHDYGRELMLQQLTPDGPSKVVELRTMQDSLGHVEEVERKLPGISGPGIKLEAGKRYRISGSYDNTTGELIKDGAMVHLIALFAPDNMSNWPPVDPGNADFHRDVKFVERNSVATNR